MNISILCSDERHPINGLLAHWINQNSDQHNIELVNSKRELSGGDILFLVSCQEFINNSERAKYKVTLVLHASDLPVGRGWSPHIWQIISGATSIVVSLLEAEDQIDSGRIWKKVTVAIPKHALWDEINSLLFKAEIELIDFAVREFRNVSPREQNPRIKATYYRRREPDDSRIDANQTIANQFDKIRVCDPQRYPAFFELYGKKYRIVLEKMEN